MPRLRPTPAMGLLAAQSPPPIPPAGGLLQPQGSIEGAQLANASMNLDLSSPPAQMEQVAQAQQPGATPDIPEALRKEIEKAILDGLINSLKIQPQANQPAFSDQFSTASKPPVFTSPMGPYR
jgi:hypothetical protein